MALTGRASVTELDRSVESATDGANANDRMTVQIAMPVTSPSEDLSSVICYLSFRRCCRGCAGESNFFRLWTEAREKGDGYRDHTRDDRHDTAEVVAMRLGYTGLKRQDSGGKEIADLISKSGERAPDVHRR